MKKLILCREAAVALGVVLILGGLWCGLGAVFAYGALRHDGEVVGSDEMRVGASLIGGPIATGVAVVLLAARRSSR